MQRMHTGASALGSVDMQPSMPKVYLSPAQARQFDRSQPMPIGQQDRSAVPGAIAPSLARRIDKPIYLSFG
jgi:hypothetical protein